MIRKTLREGLGLNFYSDDVNKFGEVFNPETGFYLRSGVIENNVDTGVDPFMRDYPGLIDIGIMGFCKNAKLCTVGCYQGGKSEGSNMSLEDYKSIIDQCSGKVMQVALGGAGSPDEHEYFKEILEYTVEHGIVPNYTTSGIGVDWEVAQITRQYCGAVACSFYDKPYTYKAIELFLRAGCKTNIHYVLSKSSIDDAIRRLKDNDFPVGINAVIFLLYKPVGLGTIDNVLATNDPRLTEFFGLINIKHPFKIGFDSCSIPGIINYAQGINMDSVDTCEGGRYSCYIHADMTIVPCSFDQQRKWGVSLREHTIDEAWHSPEFDSFRFSMSNACPNCQVRANCMGGCPILPNIVLCSRTERG